MLQTLWPRAKSGKIDAIVSSAPDILRAAQINTPLRLAHLMAQISHENGGGTIVRENMNYSADRMLQIFGLWDWKDGRGPRWMHSARVTPQEAAMLAHKPREISNRVYGTGNPTKAKELGNTQSDDGWRYRGNGDLQLTGRASHAKIGEAIGVDLVNNPEQLEDPKISFQCAVAEFVALNCLPAADADNILLVTKRVNGGTNGLGERKAWLAQWKTAISRETAQVAEASHEEIEESLEADKAPRASEVKPAPMSKSTVGTGAVVAGTAAGGGILSTITEQISALPSSIFDLFVKMVEKPTFWLFAICGSGAGYVYYRRYVMKRDEGV